MRAVALIVAALAVAFGSIACGSRPDGVTQQFFDRMAALDVSGMSGFVCEHERADFRGNVDFLDGVSDAGGVQLEDFEARTERTDGTVTTLSVRGRFVSAELGEQTASGRVRLVRDGGEWCISGERDGFGSITNMAGELFSLLVRGGISDEISIADTWDGEWIVSEPRTPAPDGPPIVDGEVVATKSGLMYVDIEEGTGESPLPGQTVQVHYTLWIEASGMMIDTSFKRGLPFEFTLGSGEVVAGFDEGISTMRDGGRRRLIVPPKLGYGRDDDYGDIPINSTLIFDVELLEVR